MVFITESVREESSCPLQGFYMDGVYTLQPSTHVTPLIKLLRSLVHLATMIYSSYTTKHNILTFN